MKRARACAVAAVAAFALGCGETPAPTTPTATNVFMPTLNGPWTGALKLVDVNSGECVGNDLRAGVGAYPVFNEGGIVTLSQTSGLDLTATVRSTSTGDSCSYSGTMGVNLLSLTASGCAEKDIAVQCTNGASRVLELVSSTINATPRGATATGTVSSRYNVYLAETGQRRAVSGLTVQYSFDAARP